MSVRASKVPRATPGSAVQESLVDKMLSAGTVSQADTASKPRDREHPSKERQPIRGSGGTPPAGRTWNRRPETIRNSGDKQTARQPWATPRD
jgi:hypothetical protein